MLLLDDEDELPQIPSEEEANLAASLGESGLKAIDIVLVEKSRDKWLKVARVIADALEAGGFTFTEESVDLHARRIIELVNDGSLEAQGNLRKPRFSEVRTPQFS